MHARPRLLLMVLSLTPALLAGCGRGKIEQCNAFINRANASQTVLSGLKLDSDDPKKLEADAAKIDSEAQALQSIPLKDEKLLAFRNDYAKSMNALATNVRDLAKLQGDAKNPQKAATVEAQAKKIEAESEKIEKDETKLISDINTYCSGK